jgi:hypothetical protein
LVQRDSSTRKLVAREPLPYPLEQMVRDLDAMGPSRKDELHYNWSAASDTPSQWLSRQLKSGIEQMKPGDSMQVSENISATVGLKAGVHNSVQVQRNEKGFEVEAQVGGSIGFHAHLGEKHTVGDPHGGADLAVDTTAILHKADATSARRAAEQLIANPVTSSELRNLDAVELRGSGVADLAVQAGMLPVQLDKASVGAKLSVAIRYNLDRQLVVKTAVELDGQRTPNIGLKIGHDSVSLRSPADLEGAVKIMSESPIELSHPIDPAALAADPVGQLRSQLDGATSLGSKVKVVGEYRVGQNMTEYEATFSASAEDLTRFTEIAQRSGIKAALKQLGNKTEVEFLEKHSTVTISGMGVKDQFGNVGAELSASIQRKTLASEKELFKGTAAGAAEKFF